MFQGVITIKAPMTQPASRQLERDSKYSKTRTKGRKVADALSHR